MPNVSELTRKEEELASAVRIATNLRVSKQGREIALREVRRLEGELNTTAIGDINGQPVEPAEGQPVEPAQPTFRTLVFDDLRRIRHNLETISLAEAGAIWYALQARAFKDEQQLAERLLRD